MINLQKLFEYLDKKNIHIDYYPGCNEPGYDDMPVCLADWNDISDKIYKVLEKAGISCEWSDEWTSCSNCAKVVRISPDSYQWQASYIIFNECELLCLDCAESEIEEYFQSLENKSSNAVTIPINDKYPVTNYGYTLVKEGFENGFHPGQNDNPKQILDGLLKENPAGRFLFVMTGQGQFDIDFAVYQKIEESEEE